MPEQMEEQGLNETQVEALADLLVSSQDPEWAQAVFCADLDFT
jgi:hypothetical protein